jgi:hypothetical protein
LRFLNETPASSLVAQPFGLQDLNRDFSAQPEIARPIDLAHAPGADEREDLVRAQAGAGSQRHV